MSFETEERLKDFAVWYKEHVKEISDVAKRTEFLERAMDNMLWLTTYLIEDIQRLEGRSPGDQSPPSRLILPSDVRAEHRLMSKR